MANGECITERKKSWANTGHRTNLLCAVHKTYLNKLFWIARAIAFRNCICFTQMLMPQFFSKGMRIANTYMLVCNANECWASALKGIVSFSFQLQVNRTNLKIRYFIRILFHFHILQAAYCILMFEANAFVFIDR